MSSGTKHLSSIRARQLILAETAPAGMTVSGHLDLSGQNDLRELPDGLTVLALDLAGCTNLERLSTGLTVSLLRLDDCSKLTKLPDNFSCQCLEFRRGPVQTLPRGLRVAHNLDLEGCSQLDHLPDELSVQTLTLTGCVSLTALPRTLRVQELNLDECHSLAEWPSPTTLNLHRLTLTGCLRLRTLPEGLRVDEPIEVAQTALTGLPDSLRNVPVRWRGVRVSQRVAFQPETLGTEEVLTEPNVEVRRIMVERVGYDRLFDECQATILDTDFDPGGERILRRIPLPRDEDLTCLSVRCPSTGRLYTLRVPPRTQSCRQAAAWLAGFDDPEAYHPIVET
jgi:Domain of unknown function (DUF6745)